MSARAARRRAGAGALALAVLAVGAGLWLHSRGEPSSAALSSRVNLLFVNSDDQRFDTMEVMPATRRDFPLRFTHMFVTTPLCCPSRSSYLSGQYAHNTGVLTNSEPDPFRRHEADSLGPWLQKQGYYTGFIGKYFNHFRTNDPTPPGWDEFDGRVWGANGELIGNSITTFALRMHWRDAQGALHDRVVSFPNRAYPRAYATTVFGRLARRFIARAEDPAYNPGHKPWALLLWPNAPNVPLAAPRYRSAPLPPWQRPPSFLEPDLSDKPVEIRRALDHEPSAAFHREVRATQLRTLMTVDDVMKSIVSDLRDRGLWSNTYGFYTSDNGREWGEHWLERKRFAYEESIRVPLLVHTPDDRRGTIDRLVANIDFAPTMLDLAGDHGRHAFDGRSFLPLIEGKPIRWRSALLLEHWVHYHWQAVRTARWKLVLWKPTGHEELYDLRADPYELDNLAHRRPDVVARLLPLLRRLAAS